MFIKKQNLKNQFGIDEDQSLGNFFVSIREQKAGFVFLNDV